MDDIKVAVSHNSPRFLDQVRIFIRNRNLTYATEKTYIYWILFFIRFNNKKHPGEMGKQEVENFLSFLVIDRYASKATQRTALNALIFLYREFLKIELGKLSFNLSKKYRRIPVVFSSLEARQVIEQIKEQIIKVEALHKVDMAAGYGEVYLPNALSKKYPNAATETAWQYLFPSTKIGADPRSGVLRRHHIHRSVLQKHTHKAIRYAKINKLASCYTFRHTFATELLLKSYDIRTIQQLMGHSDISTTEIYLHVIKQGGLGVKSPADDLLN